MKIPHARRSNRTTKRRLFLFVGVPVSAFLLTIVVLYAMQPNEVVVSPTLTVSKNVSPAPATAKIGSPSRLEIADIGVDTLVAPVGLASNGDMDIKENPAEVAWYQHGPRPGEIGSAVIAGHYGWNAGEASVFTQLHTLQAGDIVDIVNDDGGKISFVVREIRTYNPEGDATEVFRSSDGKAHLNLITCDGLWNNAQQTYSTRLVVFTDRTTK